MSDDPSRYLLGIEMPILPVIVAIALPVFLCGFAVVLGAHYLGMPW